MVHFTHRGVDFAHDDFEVVNQGLHVLVHLLLGGQVVVRGIGVEGAFGQVVQRLVDDAQALPDFLVADDKPVIGVAVGAYRNVELEVLVGE
jgi:hypothetical protein